MRFSIPILTALLATSSFASPTVDLVPRTNTSSVTVYVAGQALEPDVSISCIINCATVLAEAACIVAAIAAGEPEVVIGCVGIGKICKCSGCIPGLSSFVSKHHLC